MCRTLSSRPSCRSIFSTRSPVELRGSGNARGAPPSEAQSAERGEGAPDRRWIEIAYDKYDARPGVSIRPAIEMHRRMDEVLNGVHHDRRPTPGDAEDAFHPQHLVAVARHQHAKPDAEGRPFDGFLEGDDEG